MKSLFNRQAERFVRERKRYKRWVALFLCLAMVVSSVTYTSLTREGRALDESTESQTDGADAADGTSGAGADVTITQGGGGSSDVSTIQSSGGGAGANTIQTGGSSAGTNAGGAAGTDASGAGETGTGTSASGTNGSGAPGTENPAGGKDGQQNSALNGNNESGETDTGAENGGTNEDPDKAPGTETPGQEDPKDPTAGTEDQENPEETEGKTLTEEEQAAVDEVVALFGALPDSETVKENFKGFQEAEDEEGFEAYKTQVCDQIKEAKEAYDALSDAQKQAVNKAIAEAEGDNANAESILGELSWVQDHAYTMEPPVFELMDLAAYGSMKNMLYAYARNYGGSLQEQINDASEDGTGEVTLHVTSSTAPENLVILDDVKVTLQLDEGAALSPAGQIYNGSLSTITVFGELIVEGSGKITSNGVKDARGITVADGGHLTMESGTIKDFNVEGNGGAILVENKGTCAISGGTFTNNTAKYYGGGLFAYDAASVTLSGGTWSGNHAECGGGIAFNKASGDSFAFRNIVVSGNSATEKGGGVYVEEAMKGASLENVTIADGNKAKNGGGMYFANGAELTMPENGNVTIKKNSATAGNGGGLWLGQDSQFTMTAGNEISENSADGVKNGTMGGGVYIARRSTFTMTGGLISKNHALTHGGGVALNSENNYRSSFFMSGGTIQENSVGQADNAQSAMYGGGVFINSYSDKVEISGENTLITKNTGASSGGGICISGSGNGFTLKEATISYNEAKPNNLDSYGGGISCSTIATIESGIIEHNYAMYGGGAVFSGSVTMKGGEIRENTCGGGEGGGGMRAGTFTMEGGRIHDNTSYGWAGGVRCGNLLMEDGEIDHNTSSSWGGGVMCWDGSYATINGGSIHDNTDKGANGGGLATSGVFTMTGGKIYGNSTTSEGGGVYINRNAVHTMTGGEIYGNTSAGNGGGVACRYGLFQMSGGEIYENRSTGNWGGGICSWGDSNNWKGKVLEISGDAIIRDNTAGAGGGGVCVDYGSGLVEGGSITGNMTAGHGGGIAANSVTTELTITGGVLKDNMAAKYGNDIRVSGTYVSYKDRTHYTICSAREMTGASADSCWIDEIAEESDDDWRLTGEIDNQSILDEYIQKEEKDGVLVETAESQKWFRYGAYTFSEKTAAAVASVDENTYGSVQEAVDAIAGNAQKNENKTIIMLADSKETVVIPGGVTATLNLAGHTLKGEVGSVIEVKEDANLTIMDSSAAEGKEGTGIIRGGSGKKIKSTDNVVRTYGGGLYIAGTVTLESGSIRNNTADYGAVYVSKNGTFNMKGGAVENNTGRGVYVYCYNEAGTAGVTAKFNLSGGKICKNTGGGVAIHNNNVKGPEMVMSGGEISDHTANVEGAGIYNYAGKFTMSNGKISNNKSSSNGGGIYAVQGNSAVTIEGGEISGNKAANGGGIRSYYAPLTITGGVIKENTATTGGGVHQGDSTFRMAGGEISSNEATVGGGIYLWNQTMNAEGGLIQGNRASYGGAIQASSSYGNINMINMDEDSTIVITGNEASVAGGGIRYNTSSNNISFTMKKGAVYGNKTNLRPSDLYLTKNTIIKELYPAKDMDAADKDGKKYTGWYDYASSQLFVDVTSLKGEKVARTYDLAASTGVTTGTGICRIIGGSTSQGTSVSAGEPGTEVLYDSLAKAIGEVEKRREADSDTADSLVIQLLENIPADYEESVTIPEGMEVTIDLNGNTLKPELKDYTFDVHNGSVLNLKNGTLSGEGMANARGIRVLGGDAESTVSKLNAENVTIQNFNTADNGGGIYATGYWGIDLNNVTIKDCSAGENGGGIYARRTGWRFRGDFGMKESLVENCTAGQNGGGVYVYVGNSGGNSATDLASEGARQITFDDCMISNNTAQNGYGGGVHVEVQDMYRYVGLTVTGNTVISGNTAKDSGGLSTKNMYQVELTDTEIKENKTTGGACGGMRVACDGCGRAVTLKNVNVHHNTTNGGGAGGAYIRGTIDISDSFFNDNEVVTRNDCGGLQVDGAATIQDTEICRNSARDMGGLYINNLDWNQSGFSNPVSLKNVLVDGNYARNNYGGIYIDQYSYKTETVGEETTYTGRQFTFENCTVSNNECGNGGGGGIGIYRLSYAVLDFIRTAISSNRSSGDGGGMYFRNCGAGTITLDTGTVMENNNAGGSGGGIFFNGSNNNRHTLRIKDGAKIRNNTAAGSGGGIYSRIADLEIEGGEITGNTANYGGGVALGAHGWWSDSNTVLNYRNAGFRMTGGTISGNRALTDGGGLHLGQHCGGNITNINKISSTNNGDRVVMSGGEITGNSAGRWGGGVAESNYSACFELEQGGKVYDNSASLAQDVYGHYVRGQVPARLSLISASEMFGADDPGNRRGIGWLDETTNRTITTEITGELKSRYYALTLLYDNGQYVAQIGENKYTSVQEAVNAIQNGIYNTAEGIPVVKMIRDSVENVEIPNGVEMVLNLNGKTLQGHSTAISCAGKLTIRDEKDSDVTSTGTITGFGVEAGGGVHVLRNGSVTMESGQIANCYGGTGYTNSTDGTKGGAAVTVDAGTFLLAGGSLNNNSANCGAAVLVRDTAGKFRMTGGVIEENTGRYGAVFVTKGTAEISGGELRDNKMTESGGAVYLKAGSLQIRGTEGQEKVRITGNEAANRGGGGIFVESGTANLKNVEISGNKATGAKRSDVALSAGGGVYVYGGRLNIGTGTVITRNNAVRGGGIYESAGTIHMVGGEIVKNTAQMGGGVAQYPLSKSPIFVLMEGGVYDNLSKLSSSGNDFYSRYEGDQEYYDTNYKGKNNVPSLTLINADAMGNRNYNVWRDDTYTVYKNNADGTVNSLYNRLGNKIGEGQYVKADIKVAYNVELTAAHYETEKIVTNLLTGKEVGELTLGPRVTDEAGVQKTTTGTDGFDTGAAGSEKTAAEKMASDNASWSETTRDGKNYIQYTGSEERYLGNHGNDEAGLYEPEQMADWESGSDSKGSNTLVRTFDTVNYPFVITIKDSPKVPSVSSGDPSVSDNDLTPEQVSEDAFYRVWFEATLPVNADGAEFILTEGAPSDMAHYTVEPVGDSMQILSGYWDVPAKDLISGGSLAKSVKIRVNGMHDGDTLKPEFECWMSGSEQVVKEAESERLTVSAMAKYNVTLDYHENLSYSGYFNIETGEEASQLEAKDNPEKIKYGTILGYGVTAELYNDGTGKGIKGIEVPADGMQFDLRFKGSLYMDGSPVKDSNGQDLTAAPYIWAYKENARGDYGKEPGSTDSRNMNWDDEDDLVMTTDYAYNAAPFNSGGGESACYNGGSWKLDTPVTSGDETVVHATLSGYSVNYSDTYPNKASNGSQNGTLGSLIKNSYVKPFSAGYVQIFYPVDEEQVKTNGYLTIAMEAAVTGTQVQSSSGKPAASGNGDDKDLDNLKSYFDLLTVQDLADGIAANEIYYADNYSNHQFGMYVFKGDGDPSSYIGKTNYFLDAVKGALSGQEGSASTPLMSTVYIGGSMNYSSRPIRTDDPDGKDKDYYIPDEEYNTQTDNKTEYEYLTAVDILQKFDAEAYTPIGYPEPVINKNYNFDNKLPGNKVLSGFDIRTSETATSWSSTKTTNAKLTILYGAKEDGSNWEYGRPPIDNAAYDYTENGDKDYDYNDGGVRDMDAHQKDGLIYFETLDDLHQYFEAKGIKDSKCVAILYELRDCCIRNGRSVSASAGMQVGNALALTGNTYCTTNDAYGWTNYRPTYKEYYTNYYNSTDEAVRAKFFALLHNETLETTSGVKNEEYGVTVYEPTLAQPVESTEPGEGGEDAEEKDVRLQTLQATVDRWNGYIKTQYVDGKKVGGTHNGWYSGNTLLIKTLDPRILINGADTIKGSGGASGERIKEKYNVSKGERIAKFEVTPSLNIASEQLGSHYLVSTGILSTGIKIDITLPEKMAYMDKSITYDYSKSDYREGELVWKEVETGTDASGRTVLHLYTNITDLGKKLPRIYLETFLGTMNIAEQDQDVANGQVMTLNAAITPVYEMKDQNQMAAKTNYDSCSIIIEKEGNNGGYVTVDDRVTEVGEDLVYNLNYRSGSDESNIELMSILPYNGDGRDTAFEGGYRVAKIEVTFSDESDYLAYLSGVETPAGGSLEPGVLSYLTGQVVPGQKLSGTSDARTEADIRADMIQSGTALGNEKTDGKPFTVTYTIAGTDAANLVQTDKGTTGIGLYARIPKITHNEGVMVKVTLSPKQSGTDEDKKLGEQLIQGGDTSNKTMQGGGNIYGEDFFFSTSFMGDTTVPASKGMIQVVKRSVSGRIWMDQKHDGVYEAGNTSNPNDDRVIKEMVVKLYKVVEKDGKTTYEAAENVYGNDASTVVAKVNGKDENVPVKTDEKGMYLFENLAAGEYQVVLQGIDKNYKIANKTGKAGDITPISFGRLSVTKAGNVTVRPANASYAMPYYNGAADSESGPAEMNAVYLLNNISLPTTNMLSGAEVVSGNWNIGLYYLDQTIEKNWTNMTEYDTNKEYGTAFQITGVYGTQNGTVSDGSAAGDKAEYTLTYEISGKGADTNTVKIESQGTAKEIYNDGRSSETDESKNYTKFTKSVTPAALPKDGTQTYSWKLENLALQAEGASGKIAYTVEEAEAFEKTAGTLEIGSRKEGLNGFITEMKTAGDNTTVRSFTADNTQVLYQIDVQKIGELVDASGIDDGFIKWLNEEGPVTQPGTKFGIYSDSKCSSNKLLKEVEPAKDSALSSFVSMPGGTYYVKETNPPLYYKLNPAVFKLVITYPEKAENEELKPAAEAVPTITLTKQEKGSEDQILTAELTVDDVKGPTTIESKKNHTVGFDVKDEPVLGAINIHKVDGENNNLAGVTFKLTCTGEGGERTFRVLDGGVSKTVSEITGITDSDGKLSFEGLTPGTYILTEISTSGENSLLTEAVTITLPLRMSKAEAEQKNLRTKGDDIVILNDMCYFYSLNYEISNEAVLKLPETGGAAGAVPIAAAVLILMAGGYLVIRRKKKENA